jgi:catechol 2,3-dioxygenase-like lactoylglutathione lyase family enzyme
MGRNLAACARAIVPLERASQAEAIKLRSTFDMIVERDPAPLTFDFDTETDFDRHHNAFKVSNDEFDGIFERVRGDGLSYGRGPFSPEDMTINHHGGGRRFYFRDPSGHLLEVLTA